MFGPEERRLFRFIAQGKDLYASVPADKVWDYTLCETTQEAFFTGRQIKRGRIAKREHAEIVDEVFLFGAPLEKSDKGPKEVVLRRSERLRCLAEKKAAQ